VKGAGTPVTHPLAQALRGAFLQHRDAVLRAPTGAGKSTIVPLALLDEPYLRGQKILMLEPRRLAARAVAARMAATLDEPIGATIGVRMRFDTRVSRATRIEVVTEGVLTRMLQKDPALEGVGCVIFDEFHERSLQADLGLALCLDARRQLAAPFRLLMMSATLDGARVAALLDGAPVVDVPGRSFAVEVQYLGAGAPSLPGGSAAPERAIAAAVRRALTQLAGDVLVFLPGAGEIRRLARLLGEASLPSQVQVLQLYGDLPAELQDAALASAAPGIRKVVLATNIAETSLTIAGVTVVVDSGLVRRARFDPVTGMSRLETLRIARDSADQRAGRAGRVAPGVCYRLWSEGAQQSLAAFTPPEILETDLAPMALELARWGSNDVSQLDWLDEPPVAMLAQARELLQRLGALDARGRISVTGRVMAQLPVHPRLSGMLIAARAFNAVPLAAELAALLSERDLLRRGASERDPDLRTRLTILRRQFNAADADRGALQRVRRSAEQLSRGVELLDCSAVQPRRNVLPARTGAASVAGDDEPLGALLALAYPDRIGRRRDGAEGRYLLTNGRGAAFAGNVSLGRSEYIVAVELDDREREARIDLAVPLRSDTLEALFAERILEEEKVVWNAREEAVLARRIRRLDALVLEDKPMMVPAAAAVSAAMLAGVQVLGIEALPWDENARNLRARLQFLAALERQELGGWPTSDDATLLGTLEDWLAPWLDGITRREQLARVNLVAALKARLSHTQQRQLEELAPRELVVPSGSRVAIDYLDDNAPCVAVRLQEVFGLAMTPRIGGGTVPITFKLLSPARRPVQITRDLAGFWKGSYLEVRKDMRGRYPKHNWPENPLEAQPTRGVRPRR